MDRIKSVFDSANIYEVRAALDVFMLMAQIAQEDNARMLEMADPERGHEGIDELAEHLIRLFKQELQQRRFVTFLQDPLV